jgi:hypothetical protein
MSALFVLSETRQVQCRRGKQRGIYAMRPLRGIEIPLKSIGWDGDPAKIRGNLYSILGPKLKYSYWSAFLPKAAKANFHQPQHFKPLLPCS